MFIIHPIFQSLGTLIALYVMKLGISRFQMVHFNQKTRFNWKQHVRLGLIAAAIWLIGTFGGLYTVQTNWGGWAVTGAHVQIGLLMIPFILFAIGSGLYMDRRKRKRKVLPLIHAILNTVMLFLAFLQIYTGIIVYREYVLGL
jgi:uncharacterized membrane protein YozB (DUF420 family)